MLLNEGAANKEELFNKCQLQSGTEHFKNVNHCFITNIYSF